MSNSQPPINYREVLLKEYTKRKSKNSRYSLRAYANHLGMTASRLSEIFSHKRGMSPELAHKIVDKLEFVDFEKELFLDLIEAEEARSPIDRNLAAKRVQEKLKKYSQVDLDTFQMMADWYHYAILDYFKLSKCSYDIEQIAKHLDITKDDAAAAIDRLMKLNLLELKEGKYFPTEQRISTPTDIPSNALKLHHQGILEKAQVALRKQSVERRFFSSVTIPISTQDIPMLKKCISEFQESLSAQLTATPHKDAVYALHFNFFDLMTEQV